MRVLWILFFFLMTFTFNLGVNAQACCGFGFRLHLSDENGKAINKAKVEFWGRTLEFDSRTNTYNFSALLGCGSKNKGILKVKVSGNNKFSKEIELKNNSAAYKVIIVNKPKQPPIFEELSVLSGMIKDENNARIVSANLEMISENGKTYLTNSNDEGRFEIYLPLGNYTVKVSQNGFKDLKLINFEVNKNRSVYLDLQLQILDCGDCKNSILGKGYQQPIQEVVIDYQKIKEKQ